jgi:hypothetical protein
MNKDEFYCLKCHKIYKEKDTDISSKWMEDYVRYMGYCDLKCFDNLDQTEKVFRLDNVYRYLDVGKRKHKWYMKNIHIPLQEKQKREGKKKIHLS